MEKSRPIRPLKRHRIGPVLLGLLVLISTVVVYRLKDQPARAALLTGEAGFEVARSTLDGQVGLIPTLYVMLEERFPRRVPAMAGAPVLQGDPA